MSKSFESANQESQTEEYLRDFPPGPLDIYRKQASFDWKKMKLRMEKEEVLRLKLSKRFSLYFPQLTLPFLPESSLALDENSLKMGVPLGKFQNQCVQITKPTTTTTNEEYDYDLVIIGGGSGGLAAAKYAAKFGKRIALFDYVKPSPGGSCWGLGGTCVNVGCIPKKLMHQAALLGQSIEDSSYFGWQLPNPQDLSHDWGKLVKSIQNYIQSLNWRYKVTLQKDGVDYFNAFAQFLDPHTVQFLEDKKEEQATRTISSHHFIIAVGGRPRYLSIEGAELCITSDDIFSMSRNPGKILIVGGSYVALECAGFLQSLGFHVTIMVRSILLRGFDQQMAELVGEILEDRGIDLMKGWRPLKIEDVSKSEEDDAAEALPQYLVTSENTVTRDRIENVYNTVVLAVGRDPCTKELQLEAAGVELSTSGKILTNAAEQCSSVKHIFAIGDVAEGRPELTPVAIQAGCLVVKRLYGASEELFDYKNIPTTIFTPLEYGCVGYAEEDAIEEFGQEDVQVYHLAKQPLEFSLPSRDKTSCYSKIICKKSEEERVVGFHYLGPNAGEITQGFALAIRLHATKTDFDSLVGIHPTCAEIFTTMTVTKDSGEEWQKTNC